MSSCFQVNARDNVATLLENASGAVQVLGVQKGELQLREKIERGHKVALKDIAVGEPIIKYGVRIGHATQPIAQGAWVHLHNLASDLDTRSSTLDVHSGAPTDMTSAYV